MITTRRMMEQDIIFISDTCSHHNWNKPASLFENYLEEQKRGERFVGVAFYEDKVAGYVTLKIISDYFSFKEQNIPEIKDLNVLPSFRRQGIGMLLLEWAEKEASNYNSYVGLGVGLDESYGAAQRLYTKLGYRPDGLGITSYNKRATWGTQIMVDDDSLLWLVKKLS